MVISIVVEDGEGTGRLAKVTSAGALAIGPPHFNLAEFNELAVANTAYNFYQPRSGKQFVVMAIFAYGDKQVAGATNATVEVYEATTSDTTTVSKTIMKFEIGQNEFHPFSNLNLLVNGGVFINAKTDDDDVHMNILGHYIDDTGERVG